MCHPTWEIYSFAMKNDDCPTNVYDWDGMWLGEHRAVLELTEPYFVRKFH